MLRTDQGQPIRLDDYRPTDFVVHDVGLTVRLFSGGTEVDALFTLERRDGVAADAPLDFVGDELVLEGVTLEGEALEPGRYEATVDRLLVRGLPEAARFDTA